MARCARRRSSCTKTHRVATTPAEFAAQLALMLSIRDKVSEIHLAVWQLRSLRRQLEERLAALPLARYSELRAVAARLLPQLAAIEGELIQVHKDEHSGELDGIHFPPKLNAKLASLGLLSLPFGQRPDRDGICRLRRPGRPR